MLVNRGSITAVNHVKRLKTLFECRVFKNKNFRVPCTSRSVRPNIAAWPRLSLASGDMRDELARDTFNGVVALTGPSPSVIKEQEC